MSKSYSKPIVLTVDDDPIILNSILSALKLDYNVRPFTSGKTALKFLDNNMADLILLDYNMPELSGFDVLEVLQADPRLREIPVIFLTGSVNGDDEIRAIEMGAMDYLLKPFKPKSLITRVRLQLELYKYRHHLEALVEEKTEELRQINRKLEQRDKITLDLLATASDLRDHGTGEHIARTTGYARIIVDALVKNPVEGYILTDSKASDIVEAVKLHDIGKIAMPDNVLLKPGRLTEEEFRIIKSHPMHGAKMLEAALGEEGGDSLLREAFDIVYCHHEKWDGTGYPRGLKGTDIPIGARITAIADVFDALTSVRTYKKAFSPKEAFDILYRDSGTHFDPYLVDILKVNESEFLSVMDSVNSQRDREGCL
ncbi:MAG: response regulator [Synergistaceae bacterium]|jgi:putative two-component system response regulator|nr:response regulator [Synergistaceae bacterium]